MQGFLLPFRPGRISLSLSLLAGLWLGPATTAEAAECPAGQIYRVSKKTCMDRAEAVRLGIVHAAPGKSAPAPRPETASRPEAAPEAEVADKPEAAPDSGAAPGPAPKKARAKPDLSLRRAPDPGPAPESRAPDVSGAPPVAAAPPNATPPANAAPPAAPAPPVAVHTVPVAPPGDVPSPAPSPYGVLTLETFAKP